MANVDFINKGIPVELPRYVQINMDVLYQNSLDREKLDKYLVDKLTHFIYYIEKKILKRSYRNIVFLLDFLITFNSKEKRNVLVLDAKQIRYSLLEYLNLDECNSEEELHKKCSDFGFIVTERKLEKKYPRLYELYLKELEYNKKITALYNSGVPISKIAQMFEDTEDVIRESLKINNVKNFCRIYSEIIQLIINKLDEINDYFFKNPVNVFEENAFDNDSMEVYLVYRYLEEIEAEEDVNGKQKYLYYLTNFFNRHKNWINTGLMFKVEDKVIMFDSLYDTYIDILVKNPTLRVVDHERDFFEEFTAEEVEEYMSLELSTAKANWTILDNDINEERLSRAIFNGVKGIKDAERRQKTQEDLKKLYLAKRQLFDRTSKYRVAEGINTFDGYVAFIYPNGKVILERFFERRKDGSEVIADEHAIYVMTIDEFYSITNLSKTQIIRDKLCKRFIHKGNWQEKVLEEINMDGEAPNKEFQGLVLEKKIEDV